MELLKKVILSACFLSIVISLADSIKPNEKFAKQIKLIFSLLFISGIFVAIANSEFDIDIPVAADVNELEGYKAVSDTADRAVIYSAESSVNDMVCRILTSRGIGYKKIIVNVNMNDDGSININEIGYCGDEYESAVVAIKENVGEVEVKRIE